MKINELLGSPQLFIVYATTVLYTVILTLALSVVI
jgi:hypothetical protein